MENDGYDPSTIDCKSIIFPIKLIPQLMKKNCLKCNKEFEAKESEIRRGYAKFCSISCSSSFSSNKNKPKPNVVCSYCGISFYKNKTKQSQSKSGLFFCCREHKDIAQRIGGIKEIHPSHYGNELSSYRDKALSFYPHYCTRCGYDKNIAALAVHHKDHNRNNNSIENLEIICCNCHAIEHWS